MPSACVVVTDAEEGGEGAAEKAGGEEGDVPEAPLPAEDSPADDQPEAPLPAP
jgi:hypothetical protein